MLGINLQVLSTQNSDVMTQSLLIHALFASLLALAFIINLYTLFREKNFIKLNRKIYLIMPAIYLLLSIALLSGVFIWAMQQFEFSLRVIVMLSGLLFMLVAEVKRHKSVKFAITKEERMKAYVKRAKILYFLETILIIVLVGI
ncbi:hypothetical protein [Helicobacter cetorum]|uniref:TerC family integral membrane protein n=1 Tax=Helicobacter cetorum (strain ATCC BAA-540 / CCUG 52418 / MIT 99-5656) TaxID=1163745 RepID=I0EU74_HELCM|nr:hypothetical protein [Helicobacter cetorum]AFI06493.1 hypothetical protein HCD_07520 [Helicobacter cetorum MIT 99-5656]